MKIAMGPVISPACQIHHTHKDHSVVSICHNKKLYLLDSLRNDKNDNIIPDGLKMQPLQIYGRQKEEIVLEIQDIMKQPNRTGCGLVVIAFITSNCLGKELCLT